MSKTLTAEEFYNKWCKEKSTLMGNDEFISFMESSEGVISFAEAYHKVKVESITDEYYKDVDDLSQQEFDDLSLTDHIEKLKQKLLEQ